MSTHAYESYNLIVDFIMPMITYPVISSTYFSFIKTEHVDDPGIQLGVCVLKHLPEC